MDGTPTSRLNDWMLRALHAGKIDLGRSSASTDLPQPKEIKITLDDKSKKNITAAITAYDKIKAAHEMHVLHYEAYGKNAIKKFKTSPDVRDSVFEVLLS